MHFHRDVLAICDCFPRSTLAADARRRRSAARPPLGVHLRAGRPGRCSRCASAPPTVLLEAAPPDVAARRRSSESARRVCFTAPTAYRTMLAEAGDVRSVAPAASASRPASRCRCRRFEAWQRAHRHRDHRRHRRDRDAAHLHLRRGRRHAARARPARPIPGYEARVVDDDERAAAAGRGRPARGARADRLPLPRRRAPDATTCRTAGTSPATPT